MSDKQNVVRSTLDITVYVECPGCGEVIDLIETNHNDDYEVIKGVCPIDGSHWVDAHEDFSVEDVECPKCHIEFNVKGVNW